MKQLKDCTPTESCNRPNIFCAYPDCARGEAKNAIKKTPTIEAQAAEITRLKEQLARTERERDQAEGAGSLHIATITEDNASEIYDGWRNVGKTVILGIGATEKFIAGYEDSDPDIYARLAGKVEDA